MSQEELQQLILWVATQRGEAARMNCDQSNTREQRVYSRGAAVAYELVYSKLADLRKKMEAV